MDFNPAEYEGNLKDLSDKDLAIYKKYYANCREHKDPDPTSGKMLRIMSDMAIKERHAQLKRKVFDK